MMTRLALLSVQLFLTFFTAPVRALRYDAKEADWNLNTNRRATTPLDYWGERDAGHTYKESPGNWRVPFYTLFLDRYVNGDPTNDNANGTVFETDMMSTQLRFGGDLAGLVDSLDYIAGMGIKVCAWNVGTIGWLLINLRPSTLLALPSSTCLRVPIPTR